MTTALAADGLSESDLQVFIDAALQFCDVTLGRSAEAGEPRIEIAAPPVRDISGLIRVSGVAEGVVYATASRDAASGLLSLLAEDPGEADLYGDLLGELAHTIVSNARAHFGPQLKVSVPTVHHAPLAAGVLPPAMAFVTPIRCGVPEIEVVIALVPNADPEMSHG